MIRPTACSLLLAALLIGGCTPVSPATVAGAPTASPVVSSPLLDDVRILSGDDMQGRDTGSVGGERARAYIVSRLEAMGVQPASFDRLQPFEAPGRTREGVKRFSGVNIVGLIPGTRVADRYIVVTAHYDHVGINDSQIYHGADDNASGVATMLELARRLKADPPEHSVLIVALDGEERGLLGAREFVKAPPVPLSSVSLNLNFDMTARAETDGHLWVTGGHQHPDLRRILEPTPAQGAVSFAFGKDTPQGHGREQLGRGVGSRRLPRGGRAVPVYGRRLSSRLPPAQRHLRADRSGGVHQCHGPGYRGLSRPGQGAGPMRRLLGRSPCWGCWPSAPVTGAKTLPGHTAVGKPPCFVTTSAAMCRASIGRLQPTKPPSRRCSSARRRRLRPGRAGIAARRP